MLKQSTGYSDIFCTSLSKKKSLYNFCNLIYFSGSLTFWWQTTQHLSEICNFSFHFWKITAVVHIKTSFLCFLSCSPFRIQVNNLIASLQNMKTKHVYMCFHSEHKLHLHWKGAKWFHGIEPVPLFAPLFYLPLFYLQIVLTPCWAEVRTSVHLS